MSDTVPTLPWLDEDRQRLSTELDAGRLGHAPMLLGAAGTGKRVLGDWLARRILCLEPADGEPCGQCRACALIESGGHPDRFRLGLLEDKTEIVVDQVRDFIASLGLTPSIGSRRVGLIEPADRLNRNAANALLKTLEEPADEVWLILVTDHEDRLPITVRSRCQRRYLRIPESAAARDWLAARHPERAADECARAIELADGAPMRADVWLNDGGFEHALAVRDALGGLLQGRGSVPALAAQWSDAPVENWSWLARYAQLWLSALMGETPALLDGAPLPAAADAADRLQQSWMLALRGRRLAERPVRHEWLLLEWLNQWRGLAAAR